MVFPGRLRILKKLIFRGPPFFFFFKETSSDSRRPVLTFFRFHITFCYICSFIVRMKSLEKNKQLKNSQLKQDTVTVSFTK